MSVPQSFSSPLLATLVHLLLLFGPSALARAQARCRSCRPLAALSWADCLSRAGPAALPISLDIGLSNWSSLYITVSLYTMTKSSAILFILFFSLLFKLEEVRVPLLLVVLLIAGGLFMFTCKSTQFNTQEFVLELCASFIGGICWTLTQILMQKAELGLQYPIDTMLHLQPLMFLGLFPLFVVSEGLPLSILEKLFCFHEAGMLFCLEICILFLATHLLGDHLSLLNWLGFAVCLFVCLSGISLHVILKAMNSKGEKLLKRHKEASSHPDLELLLHPTEHGEEEEEDLETHSNTN